MKIGELLLQQGLVDAEQLERGLAFQRHFGTRLGSSLVELGLLEVDTLARVLSGQQRVPAVLTKHVEAAIDPKVISVIPARIAIAHHAVPLGFTQSTPKRLVVALRDPAATPLEEIAFLAGTRVDPGVAPEILIRRCLERHYGLRPEPRSGASSRSGDLEARLASAAAGYGQLDELSSALESMAPALPKRRASKPMMMLSVPPVPPTALEPPPPPPPSSVDARAAELAALEQAIEAERVVEEGIHDHHEVVARHDPHDDERALDAAWDDVPLGTETRPSDPGVLRPVLSVEEAIAAMHAASSREDIGETLATWLESTFGSGLVLIVKDGTALGWKGYVRGIERDVIESIAMPLGPTSMLTDAYEKRAPFIGPPPSGGAALQSRLWKLLRCAPPNEVVVAPVVLGSRVVNLLYAHPEDGNLAAGVADDVKRVVDAASAEYARLIRTVKGAARA